MRRLLQEDEEYKNLSFGEISRIVGVKVIIIPEKNFKSISELIGVIYVHLPGPRQKNWTISGLY